MKTDTHDSAKRLVLTDGGEAWPAIKTNKDARAYAEACFQALRLDISAKLLLHLMTCKWHPDHGWKRGHNSIARLMAVPNSTASRALKQLLALGVIFEIEPGGGRRAPVYDFGPNRVDVLEPLYPRDADRTQTDLHPADVDATDTPSGSVTRMQKPPLYPRDADAFGIRGEVSAPYGPDEPPDGWKLDPYAGWEPEL
ncbi:hypothetical protein [Ruegeria sp. HKCCD9179]|uniref:hypothetical protein n=1 Tax=Ruegeria sp. HKCCD9179 TaxID=2683016 RepID=UPI00148893C6|nr:hypothetical protein [Ruegeria sp. HKCCD9179]